MAKKKVTKTTEPTTEVVTPSVLPAFTDTRMGARKMKAYLFKQGKKVTLKEARALLK
jgi:hypothetical protein